MNYITDLTKDELRYICSVIPFQEATSYFRRYPKEFTRLRPGFRVKSLKEAEVARTLFDFRNRDFIGSFIVKHIDRWLEEINDAFEQVKNDGLNEEESYIHVLARSFFSHNVPLYFKVTEQEKSEEYLHIMTSGVNQLIEIMEEAEKTLQEKKKELSNRDQEFQQLQNQIDEAERNTKRLNARISKLSIENDGRTTIIAQKDADIEKLNTIISDLKKEVGQLNSKISSITEQNAAEIESLVEKIETMTKNISEFEQRVASYRSQLSNLKKQEADTADKNRQLADEINAKEMLILEMRQTIDVLTRESKNNVQKIDELNKLLEEAQNKPVEVAQIGFHQFKKKTQVMPLRPVDLDDFDEYLQYNFNDIGLDNGCEGYDLFVRFFEQILFDGVPLLMKHGPGVNLANCVANTLYGQKTAAVLAYSEKSDMQDIKDFLENTPDRVICIDGFVGNINEMEMLPVLEQYRNKIIILTYMYDRTLNYTPSELLTYLRYINVDEFKPLLRIKDITEDPSEVQEETYAYQTGSSSENRYQKIFKEIGEQCGIAKDVVNSIADSIQDEDYMNAALMFTLLPYLSKVLRIKPYNYSKRLQKYAGESGKCPHKNILLGWFG